jgi:hypothetical membrane protein
MAVVSIAALIAAYIVEIVIRWPSVAVLEVYGAIVVGIYLAILARIVGG